jgi:mannosyltransferase OCH1-like enzyme
MKWDEHTLREECAKISPEVQAKFDSFPYMIQKIDLARYVVLYNYGGISVDTDMKSFKSIKYIPGFEKNDFIVSYVGFPGNIFGILNNALIICKKNHPILHDLIMSITQENLLESDYAKKELYIYTTTGPYKFNSIIKAHTGEALIIDNKYLEPCLSMDPFCKISPDSIMDHKHEVSWMDGGTKLFLQLCITLLYFIIYLLAPALLIVFFICLISGKFFRRVKLFFRGRFR